MAAGARRLAALRKVLASGLQLGWREEADALSACHGLGPWDRRGQWRADGVRVLDPVSQGQGAHSLVPALQVTASRARGFPNE